MGFFKQVHEIVKLIPEGRVMSYGDIAKALEKPKSARMVGWAMKLCPTDYPWHRVVRNDGRVVSGDMQVLLLYREKVPFKVDGYVDIENCRLTPEEMTLISQGAEYVPKRLEETDENNSDRQ